MHKNLIYKKQIGNCEKVRLLGVKCYCEIYKAENCVMASLNFECDILASNFEITK